MFWESRAYLDYAAGSSGNPSSPHAEGRQARESLEEARKSIARLIEVQVDDVIFTSGATEANALAILGAYRARKRSGAHLLYLPTAHASIVENMNLAALEGAEIEQLPLKEGAVDTVEMAKHIRPETLLVAMEAVCGETGIVWNTREVAQALRDARGPAENRVLLHVDASQAPRTENVTRAHFGADMLAFDASKLGPVRGIGALITHRTIPLVPLYAGGGQERGLRPGSEAPDLARRFAEALQAAASGRRTFRLAAEQQRRALTAGIRADIPDVQVTEGRSQAPNILNISLPGRDTDYLVMLLDEAGFGVSTRSACETNSEEGSRAVFALTNDAARAHSTLRISLGPPTKTRQLERFARALCEAVAFVDTTASR